MEMKVSGNKSAPADGIASLITFMEEKFGDQTEILQKKIARLKQDAESGFLEADDYPYTPSLGKALDRLQESRLLSPSNQGDGKQAISSESKAAIIKDIVNLKLADQTKKLRKMASELEKTRS